ncbi:hypothetical protein B296_00037035 [Ensete ventricosum]|uniref:Uncharacterized protein n=1 Tax=Ensete ventricosum TaxID=4639 RepID=A0A426XZK8_ENSVE|nr:hypothetical protein B296_00037035 [Ensete ventricosum]
MYDFCWSRRAICSGCWLRFRSLRLCNWRFHFHSGEQLKKDFSMMYSCINLQICSLWMSFGVYVTGILFQTASFVSFMLISHGYCIIYERLSVRERRTTAALSCILYLTFVGYRAAVPYFTVILLCEMDAADFNDLVSQECHVGVQTSFPSSTNEHFFKPVLIIVQNPRSASRHSKEALTISTSNNSARSTSKHGLVEDRV